MEYQTKKTYRPMKNEAYPSFDVLYKKVRSILEAARANVYRVANTEMVQAYLCLQIQIVSAHGERTEKGTHQGKKDDRAREKAQIAAL